MARQPKPNITQADEGGLYLDEKGNVWRLIAFVPPNAEPEITMRGVNGTDETVRPLSGWSKFRRLLVEGGELAQPPKRNITRKHKTDPNTVITKEMVKSLEGEIIMKGARKSHQQASASAASTNTPDLSTFRVHTRLEDNFYKTSMSGKTAEGSVLVEAVARLFVDQWHIEGSIREWAESQPDSEGKTILLACLVGSTTPEKEK